MKQWKLAVAGIVVVVVAVGLFAMFPQSQAVSQKAADKAPFGGPNSVSYAETLWTELETVRLVGDNPIYSHFYEGIEPHGFVLEVFDTDLTIGDHTGRVVVKRNYGPAGVAPEDVSNDPAGHLAAVTVMYRREAGYDEDNKNWFWAKYLPNGDLDKNPKDMQLAGRVAKGADVGCIACHSAAPGEDYLFITDRAD
jgi:hypothetical protein